MVGEKGKKRVDLALQSLKKQAALPVVHAILNKGIGHIPDALIDRIKSVPKDFSTNNRKVM